MGYVSFREGISYNHEIRMRIPKKKNTMTHSESIRPVFFFRGSTGRSESSVFFSKVVSTHLWNTPPKPLPTDYKGIPFIIGYGDCLGCALGVC